jgi:S1-C subfamily serine protease
VKHGAAAALFLIGLAVLAARGQTQGTGAGGTRPPLGRELRLPARVVNAVFRPTINLRQAGRQGSGTVIASYPGETIILTAAHCVAGAEPIDVELHAYNLARETRDPQAPGKWPRRLPAVVVGRDDAADVALVRVAGLDPLPYVARVDLTGKDPAPGPTYQSVGVDLATALTGWRTGVVGQAPLDLKKAGGTPRPFTLTDKAPEFGHSGGGLFRMDGVLVGVCVGRATLEDKRTVGIFATAANLVALVDRHGLRQKVARRGPRAVVIDSARP